MATIKSFTDISQSKVLAEILPLESADMTYCAITEGMREKWKLTVGLNIAIKENLFSYRNGYMLPCWSLARLLNILPEYNLQRTDWGNKTEYKIVVTVNEDNYASKNYDDPLDACYELILKLHKLNLL